MKDNRFEIEYDLTNGGVSSLVNARDPAAMNWVEGDHTWGVVKDGKLVSCVPAENGVDAVYETRNLTVTVRRRLRGDRYRETYLFRDRLNTDVFFNRGALGVYATFNDNYETADICMTRRCNTHIWCGGGTSYVNAVKMGPCEFGLGLALTQGSLDTYSVERPFERSSDDRGDFILHPMPFHLRPGEEMCIEWELFWYETGHFEEEVGRYPSALLIEAEHYTVFTGEKIRFSVPFEDALITFDGNPIHTTRQNGQAKVEFEPSRLGEHVFTIHYGGRFTLARFFVQIPIRELIRRRVEFIVRKQQFHCPGSALDGAYLIYDNQDQCLVFDDLNGDYNASRERLVMGILIAKYLQYDRDPEIYDSLMTYYRFVCREFFDEDSGIVYNTVGKNPEFKRLYNGPWMGMFMMELYRLTGEGHYLENLMKIFRVYYSVGGERFYPNGLSMYEMVEVLRDAGRAQDARELEGMFVNHVENMITIDLNYPTHEVRYEQTIVTPAVNSLAQVYRLTGDQRMLDACKRHLDVLSRFNGLQPSYKLCDLSIRHWDGKWFGKRMMFGDTFPHSAAIHTSAAFMNYYWASGDEIYRKRAIEGARNGLCLFRPDGSAHTCFLYPLTVNGIRCEYYDEFANEQDGYLYYLIKFFGALDRGTI